MGMKSALAGIVTALAIASSPVSAKEPKQSLQRPRLEHILKKESVDKEEKKVQKVHPAFRVKRPKMLSLHEENPSYFTRYSFGISGRLRYFHTDAFSFNTHGIISMGDLTFDPLTQDLKLTLRDWSYKPGIANTPLNDLAWGIFAIPSLSDMSYGGLTLPEWYNVYRLFYNRMDSQSTEDRHTSKGHILGDADARTELFSTLYFRRHKHLIRYDHALSGSVIARGSVSLSTDVKFGKGISLGLHPFEKFFGTSLGLRFCSQYLVDLAVTETHQLSTHILQGWQGVGFTYQEFLRARGYDYFRLDAAATQEQLDNLRLVDLSTGQKGKMDISYGNSYLFYLFRQQSFKRFWYYAMLGVAIDQYSFMNEDYNILEQGSVGLFLDTSWDWSGDDMYHEGKKRDIRLAYAWLAGLNMADLIHPYFGSTNYPVDRTLTGLSLTLPYFVADVSVESNDIGYFSPRMEFFIPLQKTEDYASPLINYFRERATHTISPFAAKDSPIENARRQAYHSLDGMFLTGQVTDYTAGLGILYSNRKWFLETGLEVSIKAQGLGFSARFGYDNWSLLAKYSPQFRTKERYTGHSASIGLVGDFDSYFLKFWAKGLWLRQPSGIMHTRFNHYQKDDIYAMLLFGKTW